MLEGESGEGGIRTPGTLRYAAFRVQCTSNNINNLQKVCQNNPKYEGFAWSDFNVLCYQRVVGGE